MDEQRVECLYCGSDCTNECPPADDGEAWANLAVEHDDSCEWVLTRAHRRPLPSTEVEDGKSAPA
jgi:hypothetical protein